MLTICSVKNFNKYKSNYNYIIVRNLLYKIDGAEHLPALAPSLNLYLDTLKSKEIDNNWFSKFTVQFKDEICNRQDLNVAIAMILKKLKKNKTVTLMCYCDTPKCHRYLLAYKFEELGVNVMIVE